MRVAPDKPPKPTGSIRTSLIAAAVVLVGSFLGGGLTSIGQSFLPDWFSSVSNSAGGWTVLAFLLVWLSRARPVLGALLGVVSFLTLNEAYGVVSNWRGFFYADPFSTIWTLVGLVAGPVLGLAASLTRYGTPLWRMLGMAVPAAVLLGEGVWALLTVADTTSPVYWWLEITGAVTLMTVGVVRTSLRGGRLLLALTAWLAGAAAYILFARLVLS